MESSKQKASRELIGGLIGKTGVGKTKIYNLLCNTRHATTYNYGSLTYEIRRNAVSHGDGAFYLLDTPGSDSSE